MGRNKKSGAFGRTRPAPAAAHTPVEDRQAQLRKLAPFSICAGLIAAVFVIYIQTVWFGFVDYDDNVYIFDNPHVMKGLTADNLAWAFSSHHAALWHPITSISHMLDVELYGKWAGGHHLTNVIIHAGAAALLFLAIWQLTGNQWRSALVAALFAVHPLRVESVAWVAERKDVLSGLFLALTLMAYAGYVRRPSVGSYLLVCLAYGLGVMSKATMVTVPFVLLLLDYWPLQRRRTLGGGSAVRPSLFRLIEEKLPLLGLAAASAASTVWAQDPGLVPLAKIPLGARLANAAVAYVEYLRDMAWPSGLAVFYPYPLGGLPWWEVAGAIAVLLALTVGAIRARRRRPYLLVGWLWYLGMMVPMLGLIQTGMQARADRFTYLPQIGLAIAAVWSAVDLTAGWRDRQLLVGCAAILLTLLAIGSWRQTAHWHDEVALFTHALENTERNDVAHYNLGFALGTREQYEEAAEQFRLAMAISGPRDAYSLSFYGEVLRKTGRLDEAVTPLRLSLEIDPANPIVVNNLGTTLYRLGRLPDAADCLERGLQFNPNYAPIHLNLGFVRTQQGRLAEAADHYRQAVRIDPGLADAHASLGILCYRLDRPVEALTALRESLRLQPNHVANLRLAAWIAATSPDPLARSGVVAVAWSELGNRLAGERDSEVLQALAAAYAESGRFPDAVEVAGRALKLAVSQGKIVEADKINAQLVLYRSGAPYRESPAIPK